MAGQTTNDYEWLLQHGHNVDDDTLEHFIERVSIKLSAFYYFSATLEENARREAYFELFGVQL